MTSPSIILYNHPLSSYAQKIRIALREKGLHFEAVTPGLGLTNGVDQKLLAANPKLQVPALVINDQSIFDSSIIMEYLEDAYPKPAFFPKDPFQRARCRMIQDVCDTQYEAINWTYSEIQNFDRATGELKDKLIKELKKQTKIMQEWLANELGSSDYFTGDEFGCADIAIAAIVYRTKYYGLALEPSIDAWLSRIQERESVRQTFAEMEEVAKVIFGTDAVKKSYTNGQRRREYRDYRLECMIKSGGLQVVVDGMQADNIRFGWPEVDQSIQLAKS